MAHVLIGFAEALPAPEVVFSLLAAGHEVSVFARRRRLPLARLPLAGVHVLPAPEADTAASIAALQGLMAAPGAPEILLPLDDAGLWLADAALGADPRSAGATGAAARLALDKAAQMEAARAAGFAVPPTRLVAAPGDLDTPFPVPAIAKPAFALRERGGRLDKGRPVYLPDREATGPLVEALAAGEGPFLLQPLLHGTGEGVFGFSGAAGLSAVSGHRRLRMMNPHGSGSSACVSAPVGAGLRAGAEAFLGAADWRGPFMLEFLRDREGTAWFMELNGRLWGSLALARRQGLEYPQWAVARALDPAFRPAPPELPAGPVVARDLGREILHLLFVLRGPKSDFHRADWPRLRTSLAGVLKPAHPRRFYNYDPAHRGFFLREAAATVRGALGRAG